MPATRQEGENRRKNAQKHVGTKAPKLWRFSLCVARPFACNIARHQPSRGRNRPGDKECRPRQPGLRRGHNSRYPNQQSEQAQHPRLTNCGDAWKNRKQHPKTASNLPRASQVSPSYSPRQPCGNQRGGLLHVHNVRKPDRYQCNREQNPCHANPALTRRKRQAGSLSQPRQFHK